MTLARLIKEAKGMITKKKVKDLGNGWFEVAGNSVRVFKEDPNHTMMDCCCRHCSIHNNKSLCSSQIAVILFEAENVK